MSLFQKLPPISEWIPASKAWLLRNKYPVGKAFGIAYVWAKIQGCPPVFGEDLLSLIHIGTKWHLTCAGIDEFLGHVAVGLIAAGVLSSDYRVRVEQSKLGIVPPPPPKDDPKP